MKISFKQKKKVMDYINECLSYVTDKSLPGIPLKNEGIIKFNERLYILASLIEFPKKYNDNTRIKRGIIESALGHIKSYRRINEYLIKKRIELELNQYDKMKLEKFYIALQLIIDKKHITRDEFLIDKTKFVVYEKNHFFKDFEKPPEQEIKQNEEIYKSITMDYKYLCGECYARNYYQADEKISHNYDFIRGLLNFTTKYSTISYYFTNLKPQSEIPPPKFVLIYNENKKYLKTGYIYNPFRKGTFSLNKWKIEWFYEIFDSYIKMNNNNLKKLFKDAIILYVDALDQIDKKHSFLYMWQVLELIVLKNKDVTGEEASRRILSIFIKKKEFLKDILNIVIDRRNKIAHDSYKVEINDIDLHQLRLITETVILFLFNHINKLNSKENLLIFYNQINNTRKTWQNNINVIRYIQSLENESESS